MNYKSKSPFSTLGKGTFFNGSSLKKISIRIFHQMLVCQKYGGVAEIRTRASLATPNDLANRPLQPA